MEVDDRGVIGAAMVTRRCTSSLWIVVSPSCGALIAVLPDLVTAGAESTFLDHVDAGSIPSSTTSTLDPSLPNLVVIFNVYVFPNIVIVVLPGPVTTSVRSAFLDHTNARSIPSDLVVISGVCFFLSSVLLILRCTITVIFSL